MKGENFISHLFYFPMKILFYIIVLFLIGCSGNKSYSVHGTILEVRAEANEFLIHHDEIPGFMMAMTMPFKLSDSLDITRYTVGDSLIFHLVLKKDKAYAANFQLLGKGTIPKYVVAAEYK